MRFCGHNRNITRCGQNHSAPPSVKQTKLSPPDIQLTAAAVSLLLRCCWPEPNHHI